MSKRKVLSSRDLVLKENQNNMVERDRHGKYGLYWLGPYVIMKVPSNGTYNLIAIEGDPLSEPTNNMHLNKCCA